MIIGVYNLAIHYRVNSWVCIMVVGEWLHWWVCLYVGAVTLWGVMRWPTAACMRRQHLRSSSQSTKRGSLRVGRMECFHIVDSSRWHLPSTVPWEDSVRRWGCKHMTYDASYLATGPTVACQPICSNIKWMWGTALGPRVFLRVISLTRSPSQEPLSAAFSQYYPSNEGVVSHRGPGLCVSVMCKVTRPQEKIPSAEEMIQ